MPAPNRPDPAAEAAELPGGAERLLALAEAAAASTADILAAGQADRAGAARFEGRDVKLVEDAASEARIRTVLAAAGLPVLGEESGWDGAEAAAGLHWVVDPLDGSFNYHRGVPLYGVAVALCRGRTPLLGAVRDAARGETFSGGPGLGLRREGQPFAPAAAQRQLLATGIPSRAALDAGAATLARRARAWTKLRLIGSAALSLAWVAAGRLDAYAEQGIMWWDVAAGLALCAAAGRPVALEWKDGHALDVRVGDVEA